MRPTSLLVCLFGCASGVVGTPPEPERAAAGAEQPPAPASEPAADDERVTVTHLSEAIGAYSNGCIDAAVPLPLDGPGYRVMRPSRERYFGHEVLIDFIGALGARLDADELGVLLVGDLAQRRGGRMPFGHRSHQSGLDADIWFHMPRELTTRPLTDREREELSARSVVRADQTIDDTRLGDAQVQVLRMVAESELVARIFVNPVIKHALCERHGGEPWLSTLRPWWGHDAHFHVRLHCPATSPDCEPQDPPPPGDGCGEELAGWLAPQPRTRAAAPSEPPPPPERCVALWAEADGAADTAAASGTPAL